MDHSYHDATFVIPWSPPNTWHLAIVGLKYVVKLPTASPSTIVVAPWLHHLHRTSYRPSSSPSPSYGQATLYLLFTATATPLSMTGLHFASLSIATIDPHLPHPWDPTAQDLCHHRALDLLLNRLWLSGLGSRLREKGGQGGQRG